MNSIRSAERNPFRWKPAWILATLAVMVAASLALLPGSKKETAMVKLNLPTLNFSPSLELPIQSELENLKADTRNAARALAASFLPDQP